MTPRVSVPDFALANPLYVGATVTFYEADASGNKTATVATLYDTPTGSGTLSNPQTLDSEGRFSQPIYIADAVIADVSGANGVADHSTGIIGRQSELQASTTYNPPSIASGATTQQAITVSGAELGDMAIASFSIGHTDIICLASVTAADTVTVTLWNRGAGAVDLASGTLTARVFTN